MVVNRRLKVGLLIVAVLLAVGGIFLGYVIYNSKNKDSSTEVVAEILPEANRESLKTGKCSDEDLAQMQLNVEKYKGKAEEAKSLNDIANCYVFRVEYDKALDAFKTLKVVYEDNGNEEMAQSTASVISNIEQFVALPKESTAGVESNEPLAN